MVSPTRCLSSSKVARLSDRRLIAVAGQDTVHFLQGLTTNNVRPGQTKGFYSAFLNAQGRVLNDVFIYPFVDSPSRPKLFPEAKDDPKFLVEVDRSEASRLLSHLKRYKLRARVTARLLDDGEWNVWSLWKEGSGLLAHSATDSSPLGGSQSQDQERVNESYVGCVDSRAPGMGKRIVLPGSSMADSQDILEQANEPVQEATPEAYTIRRILKGVPEGQQEILRETALLQESNIDYMGGVDFRKGCYVGQELTIRTHHTGVVRKRILPVQLYESPSPSNDDLDPVPRKLQYDNSRRVEWPIIAQGTNIFRVDDEKRRSAGKWIRSVGNIGLALCRLETMTDFKLPRGPRSRPESTSASVESARSGTGVSSAPEFAVKLDAGDKSTSDNAVRVKAFVPNWHPSDRRD